MKLPDWPPSTIGWSIVEDSPEDGPGIDLAPPEPDSEATRRDRAIAHLETWAPEGRAQFARILRRVIQQNRGKP